MSSNEPPTSKKDDLDELKSKLDEFVHRSSVSQFEGEDIIQLIEEGESLDFIVDQLKANRPDINTAEITALLTEIKCAIAPEEILSYGRNETSVKAGQRSEEPERPDVSEVDLSRIDLSQIADILPAGVDLPPGLDMNEVKNLMESDQGKIMADFLLFCSEKGIEVSERFLNDPRIQELQAEWSSTPRKALGGKTPGEIMKGKPDFIPQKIETFRRAEPRVGRNDPCPCGSGKKFKKCCGRA